MNEISAYVGLPFVTTGTPYTTVLAEETDDFIAAHDGPELVCPPPGKSTTRWRRDWSTSPFSEASRGFRTGSKARRWSRSPR
jgi:hypothetical protein